ncbi:serine-type D-Ala-D-Ala carboxypeptidase [Vibrio mangrovi]|uniref:D-alanyl-D-alanine carboxypeptidase DacB n=1 Tax=Vibrio mangrovi TaxID=474394 RepID=A0A1Y6IW96_9VIBR|nr:serine-type D-Ala-D-Ala carboxypeptidase [Vibrio mangrovi]MDW6003059.1 serine-type D-Ala-D-Ala carboxypeptidase [Vibrio mangrovi]SMS01301.1 D-alanyl-D-alanine carboxypeptidase DacB precursor [Vibrio mangrovi]
MLRTFLFTITILLTVNLCAAQATPYTNLLPPSSRTALIVEQLDSSLREIDTGSQSFYPPASTMKLITALAAKLELGDQFRFKTVLGRTGNDVIVHFSGDPQLTTDDLKQLFVTLKQQGIAKIDGDLWLDNSLFTGYERAVGWPWDILGVCYSAPSSVIVLDDNCVPGSIYTQTDGRTRVYIPEQYPIHVSTQAKTVSLQEQKQQLCDLELHSNVENNYRLSGCLVQRGSPLPLKFALQNTSLYATRIVYKILNQLGIDLRGNVIVGRPPVALQHALVSHESKPLVELLDTMLKDSDNLIANNVTKTLGHQFFVQAGSFANGTEAIKQILYAKAGIDLKTAQLVDGSGLSRNNRVTANQLAAVLRYIWKNEPSLHLIELLPVAGQSGTLKYRKSMRSSFVKGHLSAKSGSIYGSYNMAGYGLDEKGKPQVLFVQFVTDYFPDEEKETAQIRSQLEQFEEKFYRDIIQMSQEESPHLSNAKPES